MSDLIAYDAATSSIAYTLLDEEGMYDLDGSFRIHSDQKLSERESEGYRAVVDALVALVADLEGVETVEPRQVSLSMGGYQHVFIFNESTAAEELAERMPIDLELRCPEDGVKALTLEEPLVALENPMATGEPGTICYRPETSELIIICKEGFDAAGLIELGAIESSYDIEYVAALEPGDCSLWCYN